MTDDHKALVERLRKLSEHILNMDSGSADGLAVSQAATALEAAHAARISAEADRDASVQRRIELAELLERANAAIKDLGGKLDAAEAREREATALLRGWRHAVSSDTGFAYCVRVDTGKAYPWPALDAVDEATAAYLSGSHASDGLRDALEQICGVGFDAPATFVGSELDWANRRASIMQSIARAFLAGSPAPRDVVGETVEGLLKLRKGIESDIRSAHQNRGNGATEWMREDDREFRADVSKAFDALAALRAQDALDMLSRSPAKLCFVDCGRPVDQCECKQRSYGAQEDRT